MTASFGVLFSASIALGACSGRFEGVDDSAASADDGGGSQPSTGCSSIQGCDPSAADSGASPSPTGNPTSTPPSPPPSSSDASAPPTSKDASTPPAPTDASSPPPQNPPGCPSAPPPPGDMCNVKGTACTWVYGGCDTTDCSCEQLGNGPASWQCSGTYTCLDAGKHAGKH